MRSVNRHIVPEVKQNRYEKGFIDYPGSIHIQQSES